MKKHIRRKYKEIYSVDYFGMYQIHTKHLVFVIIFKTEEELKIAKLELHDEIIHDLNILFASYLNRSDDLPSIRFISD